MTIDEAIAFCNEKANNIKLKAEPQVFIQLAEWLEELKELKSTALINNLEYLYLKGFKKGKEIGYYHGYNNGLSDFIYECDEKCGYYSGKNKNLTREDLLKIAEQLKVGVKE